MTREQLIEAMARAGIRAGIQSEELAQCVSAFMLTAIEAAGLCIVPREPDDAFWETVQSHDGQFSKSGETYPVQRNLHRAMIDAGKI